MSELHAIKIPQVEISRFFNEGNRGNFLILKIVEHNSNFNEVFVAGATFTGTVLAIFFTLIALPIENILSKYSQDLIKRIQRDVVFVFSFIFLIVTFSLDVSLIAFGGNRELTLISLALSIDSVLVLALLVIHTFYMLDVRNQLNDIARGIKRQIKSKVHKSENRKRHEFKRLKKFLNL